MPHWISRGTLLLKIAAVSTLRDCNQEGCGSVAEKLDQLCVDRRLGFCAWLGVSPVPWLPRQGKPAHGFAFEVFVGVEVLAGGVEV